MTIIYHRDLVQGSDEWLQTRCGLLTASEIRLIISPPPEIETRIKKNGEPYKQREWEPAAENDKVRAHIWELLAQRITRYVEPSYIADAMLRGWDDEIEARAIYAKTYQSVEEVGFVTNDEWGFTIGYSPDGLVGDDGLLECKSRKQRFQVETIAAGEMPDDFAIQVQTGLLVTKRKWLDFCSYSGGLPMVTIRIEPDPIVQEAIIAAATAFEAKLAEKLASYRAKLETSRLIQTERRVVQEMFV